MGLIPEDKPIQMPAEGEQFLPCLTSALQGALSCPGISTKGFVAACEILLPVFDQLGTVFYFAKCEFLQKNESLEHVVDQYPTLKDVVEADRKKGTVTKKNSCARNLHRLKSAIVFVEALVANLTTNCTVTLREAASSAYDFALAPIHTYVVRGAVKAGILSLPSRANFLRGIRETEATAREHAARLITVADEVVRSIDALYDEPMPASTTWFISS